MTWSITLDGLALPLRSLQVNRRLNAFTWGAFEVALPVEHIDAALAASVVEVFHDSVSFLSATITEASVTRSSRDCALSVRGRLAHIPASPTHWIIANASKRVDDTGRRVLGVPYIEPTMRPNHTIDDGEQTWTVGAILYEVSTDGEQMRIRETL